MMRMRILSLAILTLISVLNFGNVLYAQGGTTSGEFLKIQPYSHGTALSGSLVSIAEGTDALFYNAAGIGRNRAGQISVSHSELFQDLRMDNISLAYAFKNGSGIGIGISYLGYGTIHGYDIDGNETGDVKAYSLLVDIGFSQRISENLSAGLAVKPIFESLGSHSAKTATFDFGLMGEFGAISIGAQLANWGGSLKFAEEKMGLPTAARVGAAYRSFITGSTVTVSASRDKSGITAFQSGLDYRYNTVLSFRAGYSGSLQHQDDASQGLSLGVGVALLPVSFDYSYKPSAALDGIHQITATYQFRK